MNENIQFTTELSLDIPEEIRKARNIATVGLQVHLEDKEYKDGALSNQEVYDIFQARKALPSTSAVSVGDYQDLFRPFLEAGKTVIHVSISSGISSTYQNACIAAEDLEDLGKVYVIDSLSLSQAASILVYKGHDMAQQDKSAEEIVAAMKALGFEGVYDMNLTADLTIIEEATELMGRIQNGGKLPMITSCSPGWIKYCEHYFPDMIENLSSCKSPQQMFGAVVKTYWAEKMGWDPKDIFFVSAIPCTAKKFEVGRPDQSAAGVPDVDVAITTRELGRMIEKAGINFKALDDETFDDPFDIGSGAGAIFGATGGVMEAALRYAAELILGKPLKKVEFPDVRGTEGIKLASYTLGDVTVNVAVASGTGNAKKLLTQVQNGEIDVQFIEIMACPGGCVNGGGQPIQPASVRANMDLRAVRAAVLYNDDQNAELRKSQDNLAVKVLYDEYFGEPNSEKAHHILHTKYIKRGL